MKKTEDELKYLSVEAKVLILMISRSLKQDAEKRFKKIELSPLSFGVLCALGKKSSTVVQLSKKMMISPPTLIPIIDSLEKKGYVKRTINPKDRRMTPIILTEMGRKFKFNKIMDEDILVKSVLNLGKIKASVLTNLLEELLVSMVGIRKVDEIKQMCQENQK